MKNLGIAGVEVKLLSYLPGVGTNGQKYNFDVGAFNWNLIQSSQIFYPLLTEHVEDSNGAFAACFPSKRKWTIDNYMKGGAGATTATAKTPYVTWTPLASDKLTGNFAKLVGTNFTNDQGTAPVNGNPSPASNYKGPSWQDLQIPKDPYPDDISLINAFYKAVGISATYSNAVIASLVDTTKVPSTNCVYQKNAQDGMWWGVQSSSFLYENMPFWVSIKKPSLPPTSGTNPTWMVIHFGDESLNNFDIWISPNQKPKIVDYNLKGDTPGESGLQVEFPSDLSRTMHYHERIEIGVMTIAGRLVVYVNGSAFVYTRVDKSTTGAGGILECKIPAGSVSIYGTNISAQINMSPMIFAPSACFSLPIPSFIDNGESVTNWEGGMGATGGTTGSVCNLTQTPNLANQPFGCDCRSFTGDGGSANPSGPFYHSQGTVTFKRGSAATFPNLPNTDFFYVQMSTQDVKAGSFTIPFGGAPYFFRLQGFKEIGGAAGSGASMDVTPYVLSVDESAMAPDYFHVKKTATVTLYNPNGIITNGGAFQARQSGITISWGWDNKLVKTFTGVVTNFSTNNTPGKEILTLQCEDYMHVLNNFFIVNSPFYDGMVAFYALQELASRPGILQIQNDWDGDSQDDYYLPSGYSFSKPVYHFPSTNKIFDCMIKIVKMYQAFMYFDAEGALHITHLPGGLFSTGSGSSPVFAFYSNPDLSNADASEVILGERAIDFNYDATVNSISLLTVDRNTRNVIIYGLGGGSTIVFNKFALIDEGALGDLDAAKLWVSQLAQRLFFPIIKTRFRTTGSNSAIGENSSLFPLDFISVDGQPFRLMSIKRSYNAETNDFNNSYEAEWLGGNTNV